MEQKKNNQMKQLHEVVDINGSKVFVENGEVYRNRRGTLYMLTEDKN